MALTEFKEARQSILEDGTKNILALILLTINAKLMHLPHEDYALKILKICEKSLIPLKKTLWICPLNDVRFLLDILVKISNCDGKYQNFRTSYFVTKSLLYKE